jgi:hypothetical protein
MNYRTIVLIIAISSIGFGLFRLAEYYSEYTAYHIPVIKELDFDTLNCITTPSIEWKVKCLK